ncbi:MAG TPA: sigma-70 family RNA polymerase sigma factor [Verrucomicrobiae bacterium]|nr:sigma-70 family RNA polymerase sigma factor [Verrucomicrobiae bacterium]
MKTADAILIENMQTFVAFARRRVGDAHLAEDVVQESLLKALQADRKPTESEDVVAWFYRILRRSIIDLYRRNDARARALEKFQDEFSETPDAESEATVCGCLRKLMTDLPEQYRDVLERVDLGGAAVKDVAKGLGESANNLTVRLHRARKQLRARVEECCKVKNAAGCLDCNCA